MASLIEAWAYRCVVTPDEVTISRRSPTFPTRAACTGHLQARPGPRSGWDAAGAALGPDDLAAARLPSYNERGVLLWTPRALWRIV